jgi:PAS domain S-box-containing protein/putative nucleotidyltransferase with HDIG domain
MKSKLAISVILFGWSIFIAYIVYDYTVHGVDILRHFLYPDEVAEIIFHILVLSAPVGSTITAYLINERKRLLEKTLLSEKQLRHAANEWRATFDSLPYGVMLVDSEHNIIKVNKYIADFAGISTKELLFNKKYYKEIYQKDKPLDKCPLKKSVKTLQTETLEYYDEDRNKHFMVSVTPLFFDDKSPPVVYAHSLIDITEIKEKEKKLIESRNAFFNMLKDVDSAHKELRGLYNNLIVAFANAIDAKSHWTRGHSENVTKYAILIAKEMGLKEKEIENLSTASLLHDIGKIGINDAILEKPGRLTKEEFEIVKKHPVKGEEILSPIKGFKHILPIIRAHHEKIDGTGYPDGLKGDEIPLSARILCAADSFDSMTSDRPYRPAPGKDYAISELKRCAGIQFDSDVVKAFLNVLEIDDDNTMNAVSSVSQHKI